MIELRTDAGTPPNAIPEAANDSPAAPSYAPPAAAADLPATGTEPLASFGALHGWHTATYTRGAGNLNAAPGPAAQKLVDDLTDAARDGDLKKVEKLLKAGAGVNGKDSTVGWTPLMHALTAGNLKIAELLLKNGARIDEPLPDGHTALTTLAKRDGDPASVEFALQHGADPNHQDVAGGTALHWAARNGSQATIPLLLKAGADAKIADGDRRTPLMEAALKNDPNVAAALAPASQVDAVDKNGDSALVLAARHADKTNGVISELLKNRANPNKGDALGRMPLWEVAAKGDAQALKALLAAGAKSDLKDPMRDTTPLFEAARRGDAGAVRDLLAAKANPNFKDPSDRTVLMEAARSGSTDAVKALVAAGASAAKIDQAGLTALQEAAARVPPDPAMIEALLKAKADPNVQDRSTGRTPLMAMAAAGEYDAIESLKQHGARLDTPDKNGRTALMEAAAQGHYRAAHALVGTGDYTGHAPPWANAKLTDKQGDTALSLVTKALADPKISPYGRSLFERTEALLQKALAAKP